MVSFLFLSAAIFMGILPIYYTLSMLLAIPSYLIIRTLNRKSIAENNLGWTLFYVTLGLWAVMPLTGIML